MKFPIFYHVCGLAKIISARVKIANSDQTSFNTSQVSYLNNIPFFSMDINHNMPIFAKLIDHLC
jgi:hypothetical protein